MHGRDNWTTGASDRSRAAREHDLLVRPCNEPVMEVADRVFEITSPFRLCFFPAITSSFSLISVAARLSSAMGGLAGDIGAARYDIYN